MKQKTLLITASILALLISGCSQKAPELETEVGKNNISDATQIAGETVSINENTYGNENNTTTQSNMSDETNSDVLNASNSVNSSANGFKSLYFGFGDYGIAASMENRMATNSSIATNKSGRIKIEGNCDEFGTDEYNYALGLKRAKSVKDNMVAQGVQANKMLIVSFGESNPVCTNPTDGCYAQNRRVDLRLVP